MKYFYLNLHKKCIREALNGKANNDLMINKMKLNILLTNENERNMKMKLCDSS